MSQEPSPAFLDRLRELGYPACRGFLLLLAELGNGASRLGDERLEPDLELTLEAPGRGRLLFRIDGRIHLHVEDPVDGFPPAPLETSDAAAGGCWYVLDPRGADYVEAGRHLARRLRDPAT